MSFTNLKSFISALRARRDIVEIAAEVDPHLEIAEIHRRVIAAGGPALLFTNVRGKRFPVVTNLFGTAERINLAFGKAPQDFVKRVAQLPEELLPPSLSKLWGLRDLGKQALRIGMKSVSRAPVLQQHIQNADLTQLPALTSWSEDGGPFVTLPLVHTKSVTGKPDNLGMYRIQIHDAHETGMHFQIGKGGGFHLFEAEERNQPLPVNLYIGGPPALILSAIAPLPENVPELLLASLVQGEKLRFGSTLANGIAPVAEAEFCISGFVPPHVRRAEGPFGDHYGYYSLKHDYPVLRPQAIWHRRDAIYPATVVGKPRQEDFFLGDYLQELLSPMLPLAMPGVRDLWSYGETGYHALSAAVMKERYGREMMGTAFRILGEGQLSLTKFLLAVDKPMDLKDFRSVLTYVLERAHFGRDLFIFSQLSMDTLDYSGPEVNKGSKGVLIGAGESIRQLPRERPAGLPTALITDAQVFSPGCLVVQGATYAADQDLAQRIAALSELREWPLIILVDDAKKASASEMNFLWSTFTRFEPARDIHSGAATLKHNHVDYTPPIVIDSRMKPWYPKELFCDDATRKLVDRKWNEYFPDGKVVMGDSDLAHLS